MYRYVFFGPFASRTYPRRGRRRRVGRRRRSLWVTKTQETHTKTQNSHTKTPCAYWTNFEMSRVPFQLADPHKVSTNPVYLRNCLLKKNQSWRASSSYSYSECVWAHLSAGRVERREAEVRLVGHQVRTLHLQDGFVSGQRCQVSVAHQLVVHSSLNTHPQGRRSQVSVCVFDTLMMIQVCFSRHRWGLTVMVVAGDPGVLKALDEGRLTGVTCPSTCENRV